MLYTYIINHWRDIVEIYFFSFIFYHSALWLKKNTYQNLLAYFYSFILLVFCSYTLNLTSIVYILAITWPLVCMLFILFHQKTLQHNFIALKSKSNVQQPSTDWLEIVVVHALHTLNNNKPIYCIIEADDSMQEFIETSTTTQTPASSYPSISPNSFIVLNAPISQDLFNLIETSSLVDHHKMLYIQKTGILKSINAEWSVSCQTHLSLDNKEKLSETWEYETILCIQHTDAIAFFSDEKTHSFTLLTNYDRISHISAQNLLDRIKHIYAKKQNISTQNITNHKQTQKKQIYNNIQLSKQTELTHETTPKKPTDQQCTP